jgi:hypothetical protein
MKYLLMPRGSSGFFDGKKQVSDFSVEVLGSFTNRDPETALIKEVV